MKKRIFKKLPRRDGVALIIVLAMLTILLALALSLSATTRAERSVVKVHTEMTNSRQLVHAAINRALLDIQLQSNSFSTGKTHTVGGWDNGGRVVNSYPGRRMFYVNTTTGGMITDDTLDFEPEVGLSNDRLSDLDMRLLLSPESREFFTYDPRTVDAITHMRSTSNAWIGLRMTGEPDSPTNTHFTYIAETVSDGIDLNFAFPEEMDNRNLYPRNHGQTPLEINWLPMWRALGLTSGSNPSEAYGIEDSLRQFVTSMGRIDTMREINKYLPVAIGATREQIAFFNTFSYNPELTYQLINNTIIPKVNISQGKGAWPTDALIKAAFLDSRVFVEAGGAPSKPEEFTKAEADTLVACLKDYVDDDMWPTDITLGSIEPVPMVNEISVSGEVIDVKQVSTNSWDYTIGINYAIELWRPFVEEPEVPFTFEAEAAFTVNVTGEDAPGFAPEDWNEPVTTPLSLPFHVFTNATKKIEVKVTASQPLTNATVTVIMDLKNIRVTSSGICDEAPDITLTSSRDFKAMPPQSPTDVRLSASGKEVVDPRFNYALADWKVSTKSSFGPAGEGELNYATRAFWMADEAGDQVLDPVYNPARPMLLDDPNSFEAHYSQMHARNGDLGTVGELGFLPYREWRTIRLLAKGDEIYHRLGEYFLVTNDNPVARFIVEKQLDNPRGKVNVNGNHLALASAFYDLPIELYPGQVAPAPVHFAADDWNKAVLFGQFLAGGRPDNGAGAFASEWDLGSVTLYRPAIFNNPLIVPANLSEFEIESFFRNTMGLLTTRNNVFTVMVMVQSLSKLDAPTSTIRAVATVWRDGMPTEGYVQDGGAQRGIHPWFIQNITYLTDYEN
jgi:hypothetical protein